MAISIPFLFNTNAYPSSNGPQASISTYFKAGGTPSNDTTIFDMNWGSNGYVRLKLTSALKVVAETVLNSTALTLDINANVAITAGGWYWASVSYFPGDCGGLYRNSGFQGQLWDRSGLTNGRQSASFSWCSFNGNGWSLQGTFGWGVSMSSSYNGWPNSAGWELSKCLIYTGGTSNANAPLISPPNVDWTSLDSNFIAYWKCRDSVGAASTIVDSTSNGYTISAGTQGMAIVGDGPYP